MHRHETRLLGLATASPAHVTRQEDVGRFTARVLAEHAAPEAREAVARRARSIFAHTGIETRRSVLADFGAPGPERFTFFPPNWRLDPFPTTAARMAVYERESVPLARAAATRALDRAGLEPSAVTHLVVTTCTGFFAPGLDVALLAALGLSPATERTIVGFMGCYAGFTALRLADRLVGADPDAVVLTVSVELCTLHFQRSPEPGSLVSTALFGDGASAAVYGGARRFPGARIGVRGSASLVAPDSEAEMSWRIGDHGFVMTLGPGVPRTLGRHAAPFVERLLEASDVRREASTGFAIHPGGPRIVEAVSGALGLARDDTAASRAVLAEHGNMSSATIGFVLEAELARPALASGARGGPRDVVALGFGPGLTMEGAVLRVEP